MTYTKEQAQRFCAINEAISRKRREIIRERTSRGFKQLPTGDEYYDVDENILNSQFRDESELTQFWEWLHDRDKESRQKPGEPRVTTA
jgi:hypothetical protein